MRFWKNPLFLWGMTGVTVWSIWVAVSLNDWSIPRLVKARADDSFYYCVIARNMAEGRGSTFDGQSSTNGYHPLWMIMHVPIAKMVAGDDGRTLKAVIRLSTGIYILAGLLLFLMLARMVGTAHGLLVTILYFVSPISVRSITSGMEDTLVLLSTVLVLSSLALFSNSLVNCCGFTLPHNVISSSAIFGLAAGAHFLARTDGAFLVLTSFGYVFVLLWFLSHDLSSFLKRTFLLLPAAMASAFLILPWLAYCKYEYGAFVQDSGLMKWLWRVHAMAGASWQEEAALTIFQSLQFFWKLLFTLPGQYKMYPVGGAAFAALVVVLMARQVPRKLMWQWAPFAVSLAGWAAVIATALYYGTVSLDYANRYFASAFVIGLWTTAASLTAARRSLRYTVGQSGGPPHTLIHPLTAATYVATVVISAAGIVENARLLRHRPDPTVQPVYEAALWARKALPQDVTLGVYDNSGVLAMFSHRRVINLDGLVNHEIRDVFQNRSMAEYINKRRIEYVLDSPSALGHLLRDAPGWLPDHLEEVQTFKCAGGKPCVFLYQILPAGNSRNPPSELRNWVGVWPPILGSSFFVRFGHLIPFRNSTSNLQIGKVRH